MKLKHIFILLLTGGILSGNRASAQLVGTNCFLQGHWLEIGMLANASFGAPSAPAGYHPYPAGGNLGETYDLGHDGWTVGTPAFNGDYTYPGSPFEGWEIQIGSTYSQAFSSSGSGYTGTAGLTGAMTSYSNTGGRIIGNWAGTAGTGGGLTIKQETRIDTEASWVVVTTYFHNTTTAPIDDIYYLRSCDPDNDEAHGGSFATTNTIAYQNDADHRVEVDAMGDTYSDHFTLCTKDYRAKCLIYTSWPISSADLSTLWAGTYGIPGGAEYTTHNNLNGDYAIGLVYKIGTIAAGDSALVSYAYTFNGVDGIDSAFPEPEFYVDGAFIAPSGPAPASSSTTYNACDHPGVTTFNVNIRKAADKCWTWSQWSVSPSTGITLTSAPGANPDYTVNLSALPGGISTFTFTGTDSMVGMNSGNRRTFILTVIKCFSAGSNSPGTPPDGSAAGTPPLIICEDDTLSLYSYGDSLMATYQWFHGLPAAGAIVGAAQNVDIMHATLADTGIYYVIRTIGTAHDTAKTHVLIQHKPVISASSNAPICSGNLLTLISAPDSVGETWAWSGPLGFTSGLSDPTIASAITANSGTYKVIVTLHGCVDSATTYVEIDSTPELPVLGSNTPVCKGDTLKLTSMENTDSVTYNWVGPNSFVSTEINPIIPNVTSAATGPYTLTVHRGTCTSTNVVEVVILDPTVTASVNTPVCSGLLDTIFLQATSSSPAATFSWTGPYSFSSGAQNPFRTPVVAEYSGIYHVTAIVGACPSYADVTVVVHQTPPAPWVKWLTYCQNYDAPPLQAFGSNVLWYTSSAGGVGSTAPPVPPTSTLGWSFYFASQTVDGCTSAIDSIKVQVNPKPTVTVSQVTNTTCPRDSVVLTAVDEDAIAYYHWIPRMYVSDTSAPVTTVWPETNMTYSVVATNQYGCTDTATATITVHPAGVISLADSVTIYPGESYQIDAITNCTTVRWTPSGGLTSTYIVNPVATPEVSTRYFINGITEWGCKAKDSIDVLVNTEAVLNLPNAFAPGSGPNGTFKILKRGIASLRHFRIYDRWGVVVFEAKDIDDGWDGNYKGVPQPVGVYIYQVEAVSSGTGKEFIKQGNLTLLR